jgi:hypothetical protein
MGKSDTVIALINFKKTEAQNSEFFGIKDKINVIEEKLKWKSF